MSNFLSILKGHERNIIFVRFKNQNSTLFEWALIVFQNLLGVFFVKKIHKKVSAYIVHTAHTKISEVFIVKSSNDDRVTSSYVQLM